MIRAGHIFFVPILITGFSNFLFSQSKSNLITAGATDTIEVKKLISQAQIIRGKDFDSALTIASRAYKISDSLNYKRGMALAQYEIAECNRSKKEFKIAEDQYLKAHDQFTILGMDSLAAISLLNIGTIYNRTGKYEKAAEYFRKHISVFQKMPEKHDGVINNLRYNGMATGYYFLWTGFYFSGRYREGLPLIDTITMLRKIQNRIDANNFNNYGITYSKLGLPDSAIYYYRKGLQHAIDQKRSDLIVLYYGNLGFQYLQKGDYELSLENYKNVIAVADSAKNYRMVASGHSGLANVYSQKGDYAKAAEHHIKGVGLTEKFALGDEVFQVSADAGKFFFTTGNYSKAAEFYMKALQVAETLKNRRHITQMNTRLGELFSAKGEHEKALGYFKESYHAAKAGDNKSDLAEAVFHFAEALLMKKKSEENNSGTGELETDSIKKLYEYALEIFKVDTNRAMMAQCYSGLAKIYVFRDEYKNALEMYHHAIRINQSIETRRELYLNYAGIADVHEKSGGSDSAVYYLKKYQGIKDSLFNETSAKQIAEIETRYETEKKDKEILLLNKDKEIKELELVKQQSELQREQIQSQQKAQQVDLLTSEKEIQQLQLDKTTTEIERQKTELEKKNKENELLSKESQLQASIVSRQRVLRNSLIGGTVLIIVIGLLLFNRFRISQKQKHQAERMRISSDLHDEIGSTLSSISMYSAYAKDKPAEAANVLEEISSSSQEMIDDMNDIIWAINPRNDSFEHIFNRLRNYASRMAQSKNIVLDFSNDDTLDDIVFSMEQRKNLFLICKEAVNNAVKYSDCKNLSLAFHKNKNHLHAAVSDDGKGFDANEGNEGNGLKNMKQRASGMHAQLSVSSGEGNGTKIKLEMKLF